MQRRFFCSWFRYNNMTAIKIKHEKKKFWMQFTTSTNSPHQCSLWLYTISFWDVLFIIWVLPECSPSHTTNSTPCFLRFELTFITCLRQLHSPSSSSGYSTPHLIPSSPAKSKIQSDKVLQHLKQRLRTRRRRGDEEEGMKKRGLHLVVKRCLRCTVSN